MSRHLIVWACALAAGWVAVRSLSTAAEPKPDPLKQPASGSKPATGETPPLIRLGESSELDKALDKPVTLKFKDTELKDVAAAIAKQGGINVVLDRKNLADASIRENFWVTCDLPSMPLRRALQVLLEPYHMGFTTGDNVLTITPDDVASKYMVVRLYNVRELAMPLGDFDQPGDQWRELIGVVQSVVAPQTWDCAGGAGTLRCQDGILVVSATQSIHEQISELLTALVQLHRAPRGSLEPQRLCAELRSPLWKKLESVQDVHFKGGTLPEFAAWLRGQGIPSEVDEKALKEASITDVTLPPLNAHNVTLRWSLAQILGTAGLEVVIDHETLLITTYELGEQKALTFVYPVGDLLDEAAELSGTDADSAFDDLMETISTTIGPQTWDEAGGVGSLTPFAPSRVLICCQTDPVQRQIERLLAQLRAAYRATGSAVAGNKSPVQSAAMLKTYKLATDPAKPRVAGEPSPGEQYAALIRIMIEPKSWTDGTASVSVIPGALVVRATPAMQARVRRLLEHVGAMKLPEKKNPSQDALLPPNALLPAGPGGPGYGGQSAPEKPK